MPSKMTENEAIERIREQCCNDRFLSIHCDDSCLYGGNNCEWAMAIDALEKQKKIKEVFTHYPLEGFKIDVFSACVSALSEIKTILKV